MRLIAALDGTYDRRRRRRRWRRRQRRRRSARREGGSVFLRWRRNGVSVLTRTVRPSRSSISRPGSPSPTSFGAPGLVVAHDRPRCRKILEGELEQPSLGDERRRHGHDGWVSAAAATSPRPSMSSAPREPTCSTRPRNLRRAAARVGAAQVDVALLRGRERGAALRAVWGMTNSRSVPSRSSTTGPSTSGITSPALRSTTVSPMSTPLALTTSWLCRVAWRTTEPATRAGSMTANGVARPVRPTRHDDVEQLRVDLLGRVLVGDRPARRAAGGAELFVQGELIDLDDDAVDLVLDAVAMLAVVLDEGLPRWRAHRG